MSDEELPPGMIKLRGNTYELASGSTVFVGVPENFEEKEDGGEGGYYIKFTHRDGHVTKVRISEAAYNALINAKADLDIIRQTRSIVRMTATLFEDVVAAKMDSVWVESTPRTD